VSRDKFDSDRGGLPYSLESFAATVAPAAKKSRRRIAIRRYTCTTVAALGRKPLKFPLVI
jgi:hypothetical protein